MRHANLHLHQLNSFILSQRSGHFTNGGISGPFSLGTQPTKIYDGVEYFMKWIETKLDSKITRKRVFLFYWKRIMCRFCLPGIIIWDNGTQFASTTIVDFHHDLEVQIKFIFVVHPLENGEAESADRVILKRIKKKSDDAIGLSSQQLYEMAWSYHTTHHSTTKETPFTMVYGGERHVSCKKKQHTLLETLSVQCRREGNMVMMCRWPSRRNKRCCLYSEICRLAKGR